MAGVIVDIALSTAWWVTRTTISGAWEFGRWSLGYTDPEPAKPTDELLLEEIQKLRDDVKSLKEKDKEKNTEID